ncbi:hypothetical protein NIES2109_04960 [Nostoc sp. HK-01]|nr:hypothetical protein NIES2109_04960 [Nostoc sp. HK-01]
MGEEKSVCQTSTAITFLTSLTWATRRENRGEDSDSLKDLTYVERVIIISSPLFLIKAKSLP